jgi:tetratricopeptide (TPR) repeat protein
MGEALRLLRRERAPERALERLDTYLSRFPEGQLRLEARLARLDALLALGRRPAALVALEELPGDQVARRPGLRLLRGELLAGAGRCTRALADFDAVLQRRAATGPALTRNHHERALYGRASCRSTLGQTDAARADLQAYLERFPDGTFAPAVRRALGR